MLHSFPLIVADESVDGRIISALKDAGYEVLSIAADYPGISDREVIGVGLQEKGINNHRR